MTKSIITIFYVYFRNLTKKTSKMIPSILLPEAGGLYNAVMKEAKSFLSRVFQTLERSPYYIHLSYSNDFSRDTLSLIGLLRDPPTAIHHTFPMVTDLTLIMLEHLLTLQNERALNFNSNIEDVIMISIMLRRLTETFSPISNVFGVEFRRSEMDAMRKTCLARNQELNEVENTWERQQNNSPQCKGYPNGTLCLQMAVGKPEGKRRCVKLCKKCMSNRQRDIAKQKNKKKQEEKIRGDQKEEDSDRLLLECIKKNQER